MKNIIYIPKVEVMAIRKKVWLFNINPSNFNFHAYIENKAYEIQKELRPKTWWKKLFYTDKTLHDCKAEVYKMDEFRNLMNEDSERRRKLWIKASNEYSLVEEIEAGSFSDHMIIIKDNKTNIQYRGFCNNYGLDNPFITFTEI